MRRYQESLGDGSLASGWRSLMGSGVGTLLIIFFSICLSSPLWVIPVWAEGKMRQCESPD